MQITMDAAHIQVAQGPNGSETLIIQDANVPGLAVILPLNQDAARTIGAALQSSLLVAGGPLKTEPLGGPDER